ncbi:hypothetical protein [Nocardioides sp. Leaf307]|uniref:hypothetical protein n=1 Tax=Nocardioides sp. Leaf307 TaxID=1736331 RepID=UPI000703151F|nr:hypothetical protein [Nocardioides sp. Leaf307]KQQ43083.1 hypothetical protein ASF50_03555 [Nocardioides sp. Leaf307]
MPDWLLTLLPYVAPLLVGLLTSGLATTLLSARRLRKDIAELQGLVGGDLTPQAKELLQEDVQHKVARLSALNRFPTFVGSDAARFIVIALTLAYAAFSALDVTQNGRLALAEELFAVVILAGLAGWHWYAFYVGWSIRQAARHRFVKDHGSIGDERHDQFVRGVTRGSLVGLGFLAIGGASVPLLTAYASTYARVAAVPTAVLVGTAVFIGTLLLADHAYDNPKAPQALYEFMNPTPLNEEQERRARERNAQRVRRREALREAGIRWWQVRKRRRWVAPDGGAERASRPGEEPEGEIGPAE